MSERVNQQSKLMAKLRQSSSFLAGHPSLVTWQTLIEHGQASQNERELLNEDGAWSEASEARKDATLQAHSQLQAEGPLEPKE